MSTPSRRVSGALRARERPSRHQHFPTPGGPLRLLSPATGKMAQACTTPSCRHGLQLNVVELLLRLVWQRHERFPAAGLACCGAVSVLLMLSTLLRSSYAFNDAKGKVEVYAAEEMQKITEGLPLPPGMKLPF